MASAIPGITSVPKGGQEKKGCFFLLTPLSMEKPFPEVPSKLSFMSLWPLLSNVLIPEPNCKRLVYQDGLDPWFLNLTTHQHPFEGLLKHGFLGSTSSVSGLVDQDGAQEFVFVTSFQVVLMLLVQRPHFERHRLREIRALLEMSSISPNILWPCKTERMNWMWGENQSVYYILDYFPLIIKHALNVWVLLVK